MTAVREEIETIRAAAALLLDRASLVPAGPWYLKQVIGRTAVCDTAGRIIAWIPDVAGADAASYIALRDPESARLEAALLNAVADGAERVLKLAPGARPAGLVRNYAEAFELAAHILEATA